MDPQILLFFKVALGINIAEGYGQTEGTGGGTGTTCKDLDSGHVGPQSIFLKLRLRDVPDMNYYHTDPNPRGELQIKGNNIFKGYFKNPEKTKEIMTEDGWLSSGDVVEVLPGGKIKIIDRAKNIFKLSQGEYIAPEKL